MTAEKPDKYPIYEDCANIIPTVKETRLMMMSSNYKTLREKIIKSAKDGKFKCSILINQNQNYDKFIKELENIGYKCEITNLKFRKLNISWGYDK